MQSVFGPGAFSLSFHASGTILIYSKAEDDRASRSERGSMANRNTLRSV